MPRTFLLRRSNSHYSNKSSSLQTNPSFKTDIATSLRMEAFRRPLLYLLETKGRISPRPSWLSRGYRTGYAMRWGTEYFFEARLPNCIEGTVNMSNRGFGSVFFYIIILFDWWCKDTKNIPDDGINQRLFSWNINILNRPYFFNLSGLRSLLPYFLCRKSHFLWISCPIHDRFTDFVPYYKV